MGENLETNGGVVLVPVGMNVEDLDAMECGVGELLRVVIDDVVGDGVPESG